MKRKPRLDVYRAPDGWRWRLRGRNGLIIADSGQGYARKSGALTGAKLARAALVEVLEVDDESNR